MKKIYKYDFILIDEYSSTPKYKQIINSIISGVEKGILKKGDQLPSINELSFSFDIARDTAEKGYNYLKELGIIGSVPGKGFFIKSIDFQQKRKIFLLFNKLSAHKKVIYDSLVKELGDDAAIDFYIYNNNFRLFKNLVLNNNGSYTHYVIIAHFLEGGEKAKEVLEVIPKDKLIILDKNIEGLKGEYGAVYENFEQDIYLALTQAKELLKKYHTIKIIFPSDSYFPTEILRGFKKFCKEYDFKSDVVHDIEEVTLNKGEVFISLMEDDLVNLIKKTKQHDMKVGQDLGIISYNENSMKEVMLEGITTISTDFKKMGETVAKIILNNEKMHIENPFHLIIRKSL